MTSSRAYDPKLARARNALFQSLRERGVADEKTLQAMMAVPREAFVAPHLHHQAYEDRALPTAHGQTISQPTVVAAMTSALAVEPDSIVLEVGTGSGYQAAILSKLARHCLSIELYQDLAEQAGTILRNLEIENVQVLTGDGSAGAPEYGPFDRILVTAAAPDVPETLLAQLRPAPGSRLVSPVGDQNLQTLRVIEWTPEGWKTSEAAAVRFVPLRGVAGWSERDWKETPGFVPPVEA